MSLFSLDNFKAEVLGHGLARPNRFELELTIPASINQYYGRYSSTLNLFCEETNFPPLIVNSKSYRIFGPSYQRPVSTEYGGEGISITFHVDREMKLKFLIEEWISLVVDPNTFLLNYQGEYITTMRIHQLNDEDNLVYTCELYEVFPRSLNVMPLNNNTTNQTHRMTVMFGYRYWRGFIPEQLGYIRSKPERTNI